jgi:S-DNA-T family DNA segregation ATPase FtsK/SpoIIIE
MGDSMERLSSTSRRSLKREIPGIVLFAIAIFTVLSLISYHPSDPSFNVTHGTRVQTIHNFGGIVGSYLSDLLLQVLGLASYLIPLALGILACFLFLPMSAGMSYGKGVGFLLVILSSATGLSLKVDTVRILGHKILAGGVLGDLSSRLLVGYFNFPGAAIIVIVVFIMAISLSTGLSLVSLIDGLVGFFKTGVRRWNLLMMIRRERVRRTREVSTERRQRRGGGDLSGPVVVEPPRRVERKASFEQEEFSFVEPKEKFHLPPLSLLDSGELKSVTIDKQSLLMNSRILEKKLMDYGVEGKVMQVRPGPVITVYEFEPAPGVKVSKIVNLADDLALALSAVSIRIVAPIPGKSVVGIEIPNALRETVYLKEIVDSEAFKASESKLTLALGKDISGDPFVIDLAKMPHLLVAGSTGSGKSVSINSMICSILLRATPDDVKFLLIDPKMLELSAYEDIPHLLLPVVTNPKKAAMGLMWLVEEMERRYSLLANMSTRNIEQYNRKVESEMRRGASDAQGDAPEAMEEEKLPYILVVIDELADLMIISSREVEESITRLAQMARAVGIHLILATQRPSVDVLTGIIKANFPARISFQVSSKVDSRTILDTIGAEHLLGMGDMLFLPPGSSKLQRVHGALVSPGEIKRMVDFLRNQGRPIYDESILEEKKTRETGIEDEEYDDKYDEAVAFVAETGQASISLIQRRFRIGYNRAARIVEKMEEEEIVGPSDGVKPREVLIHKR